MPKMRGENGNTHVLTSLRCQNGYCECGESQRYHYGRCAMLKLIFVAPKFRLRRVRKRGKKSKKWKIAFCKKKVFYFCIFTSWTLFWGSIRIEKIMWGRCARQKNFLTFWAPVKVRNFGNFVIHARYNCFASFFFSSLSKRIEYRPIMHKIS